MNATLIGVGIDTARYGHHVSFFGADRKKPLPGFHFAESKDGYAELSHALDQLVKKFPNAQFSIRVDAAGQYAANVLRFLESLPHQKSISVGQPKQNKDYRNVHFPKRKADSVDSLACARFAAVEQPEATAIVPVAFTQLREVLAALQGQSKRTTRLINQLHNRLARAFPELAVICSDVAVGYVIELLTQYPTAQKVAAASLSELTAIAFLRSDKAKQIHDAAKQSTASLYGPAIELIVSQLAKEIKASQGYETQLGNMLEQVFDALPAGHHQQLLTIGGVGKLTAAAIVAAVVSLDRFASPEALVNFFGVFPEAESSGTDKFGNPLPPGPAHMSKKGNDLVRKMLYMSALNGIQHNPLIRAYYARLKAKGKSNGVALGHCMRKLLHLIYAIWTTGKDFDPAYGNRPASSIQPEPVQLSVAASEPNDLDEPIASPTITQPPRQKSSVGRKEQSSKRQAVTTDTSIVGQRASASKRPIADSFTGVGSKEKQSLQLTNLSGG
jgi:transposase